MYISSFNIKDVPSIRDYLNLILKKYRQLHSKTVKIIFIIFEKNEISDVRFTSRKYNTSAKILDHPVHCLDAKACSKFQLAKRFEVARSTISQMHMNRNLIIARIRSGDFKSDLKKVS